MQKPCRYQYHMAFNICAIRVLFNPSEDISYTFHCRHLVCRRTQKHYNNNKQLINHGRSTALIRPILRHFHHQMHRYILENTIRMANSNWCNHATFYRHKRRCNWRWKVTTLLHTCRMSWLKYPLHHSTTMITWH